MARWGEGDPRWIVEERADAKNVNNWHWCDKDATSWSAKTIKTLLQDIQFENNELTFRISDVPKCEGEANVNVRKGKLIYLYEWQVEADWIAEFRTGDNKTKFKGKVEILNLSDEYTIDELDTNVNCTSNSPEAEIIRIVVKSIGTEHIKSKLKEYLKLLREEYAKDLILPTKNDSNDKSFAPPQSLSTSVEPALKKPIQTSTQPKDVTNQDISITDEFFCTPEDLYRIFTTKELVQAFTRSEAIVDAQEGGNYSIFGGNISGVFVSLTPCKTVQMKWRKRDWPENHFSSLTLEFTPFENGTRLLLKQSAVPKYDLENTRNGWHTIFLSSLKQTYGYGGRMF